MTITLTERRIKTSNETVRVAVDFTSILEGGDLLTGTPTVTDGAGVLTLSSKAVSTEQLSINGTDVSAAKAVTFTAAGGTSPTDYTVTVNVSTTGGFTRERLLVIQVRDA